jgi:hypothetical protein
MSAGGREVFIDGIALWAPMLPGWPEAAAALRGDAAAAGIEPAQRPAAAARPAPSGLAANERRRAPDSVLVALHVAEQAAAISGQPVHSLASVFTSAHGDLPIIDALLRTLANEPQLVSPTRFHHSVHNAPSGYWAIAAASHAASTALAAYDASFAAGLLEALVQTASDGQPVLLAGCDTEATGALASVNTSRGLLGLALVLAPRPGARTRFALRWQLDAASAAPTALRSDAACALAVNAIGDGLALFEALAHARPAPVCLRCGGALTLRMDLRPWPEAG